MKVIYCIHSQNDNTRLGTPANLTEVRTKLFVNMKLLISPSVGVQVSNNKIRKMGVHRH